MKKIRVVAIDDSAIVRAVITKMLHKAPDIEVVATAPDPFVGRDMIVKYKPDVLLLDIEMPRMDGITFLQKLMSFHPVPTIMVSSLTREGSELALRALRCGAVDVVPKPRGSYTLGEMGPELIAKVHAASRAQVRTLLAPSKVGGEVHQLALATTTNKIFAVGASTGGVVAFERVLRMLPHNCPAMVVTQHMPEAFTKSYADRLNELTPLLVKEAEHGESATTGKVLIAPGGRHMALSRSGAMYQVLLNDSPPVGRHRPSVNVLFDSVAACAGKNAIGALLTGMGEDGAQGLLKMRQSGSATIAQDETTSTVYGMPKAAVLCGATQTVLALDQIAPAMLRFAEETQR